MSVKSQPTSARTLRPLTEEEFRRLLVRLANIAERTTPNTIDAIREACIDCRLVFLVWSDLREADGLDFIMLKGEALLRDIINSKGVVDVPMIGAVWVSSSDEAPKLRARFGEHDQRH